MGLDISFDRKKALAAGMERKVVRNGTDGEIRTAEIMVADGSAEQEYLNYLRSESTIVQIPGTDWWLDDYGLENNIVVRANMWGKSYAPLTKWLKENNIPWESF